jgi:hypothetical protein
MATQTFMYCSSESDENLDFIETERPDRASSPAKDAASAIAPKVDAVAAVVIQSPPAARYPWEDAPGSVEAVKLVNFKIPIKLYLKLKYLGDTTYGSSMTQIFVTAMEKETARLLREREKGES